MFSRLSALLLASCIVLPVAVPQAGAQQAQRNFNFSSGSGGNSILTTRQQRQQRQQRQREVTRTRSFDFTPIVARYPQLPWIRCVAVANGHDHCAD